MSFKPIKTDLTVRDIEYQARYIFNNRKRFKAYVRGSRKLSTLFYMSVSG